MGSMGDAFSETATYTVGDYCIYQDVLYKFIAAKNAGAWDVNAVSKTTIDAELKSLFNQVSELNANMIEKVLDFTSAGGPYFGFTTHDQNPMIFVSASQNTLTVRYKDENNNQRNITYILTRNT